MRLGRWVWAALAVLVCVASAAYVVQHRAHSGWYPATDLYAYFYPKVLYALSCLAHGGRGLLWNPYQSCGEPFLALPQTGIWYPVYLLFLVFEPGTALSAVLYAHLIIGGTGAYLLGRTIGARPLAAIVGAVAFETGSAMQALTISSPIHCAPFAWLPLALWACERLLRTPSLRRALVLAGVLAVAILPGMPQTVFLTYQLIALRVLWELISRGPTRGAVGFCLLAFALAVGLAAIELLPELEVVKQSVRPLALAAKELSPLGQFGFRQLQARLATRSNAQPFLVVPVVVGAVAVVAAAQRDIRRVAAFYLFAAALSVALACGPGSPVYDLYRHLPLATLFRMPARFLWITSFCLSVLAALGTEALASVSRGGRARPLAALGAVLLALAALRLVTPHGLSWVEWGAAGLVLLAAAAGFAARIASLGAPVVVAAAMFLQVVCTVSTGPLFLMPAPPSYLAASPVFKQVQAALGPADRVDLIHRDLDLEYRLTPKTASILGLPAISDYEPIGTQRYAEFSSFLRTGRPLQSLNQALYGRRPPPQEVNRRLLDLTGVRYLIVDTELVPDVEKARPPFLPTFSSEQISVFENPQRLPRALWVPSVELVPEPATLMRRLANGNDDLHRVALVEKPPASGFLGRRDSNAQGDVRFTRNDPEHVTLEVAASERGFVLLADQYFPGWFATVDGSPADIDRADYVFRLVEVPAGTSIVDFRYSAAQLVAGSVALGGEHARGSRPALAHPGARLKRKLAARRPDASVRLLELPTPTRRAGCIS